jgi:hypothetical protein|tara:strand:- start:302 stop:415 length:114 start_codon:yes stop_codon:yes gene_type:complete
MKGRVLLPSIKAYDPANPPKDLTRQLVLWGMNAYVIN